MAKLKSSGLTIRMLIVAAGLWFLPIALKAASVPLRLAIAPFSVPPGNEGLRQTAEMFQELLMVTLSQQNHFQLVERAKVSTLWSELQLAANGLNSTATMLKLGRVLACDRLVGGSFVTTTNSTQVWATVIDTHNGVVTDLQVFPFNPTNIQATLDDIAAFLDQTRVRKAPQQFIALGRFVEMSISSRHEDWSGRLRALIERHFHDAGFGVVELEAVTPIFEEFQLEQAGFSETETNRVKFQPSFWLVDGGCKWVRDTEDKLSVAVRIRKPGSSERILRFRALPDSAMETNIIETISQSIQETNQPMVAEAEKSHTEAHKSDLEEFIYKSAAYTPLRFTTNQNPLAEYNRDRGYKQEVIKAAQKVLLSDPDNLLAKKTLGELWVLDLEEPALRERGIQILEELTTSTNASIAEMSELMLTSKPSVIGKDGKKVTLPPVRQKRTGSPSFPSTGSPRTVEPDSPSNSPAPEFPAIHLMGSFPVVWDQRILYPTFYPVDNGWLISNSTNLIAWSEQVQRLEKVNLPITLQQSISTLAIDEESTWLGTSGGGLIRIYKSGKPPRIYSEADGLLLPTISALCRVGDKLWIGFGFQHVGGLGYLDLTTDKFIGLPADVNISGSKTEDLTSPPTKPILAIHATDKESVWIVTGGSVRRFDATEAVLKNAFAVTSRKSAASTNYIGFDCNGFGGPRIKIFDLAGNRWNNVVIPDSFEGFQQPLCADGRFLLVGGNDMIKLIDMGSSQEIANYQFTSVKNISWIGTRGNDVWFTATDYRTFNLYSFTKPAIRQPGSN